MAYSIFKLNIKYFHKGIVSMLIKLIIIIKKLKIDFQLYFTLDRKNWLQHLNEIINCNLNFDIIIYKIKNKKL